MGLGLGLVGIVLEGSSDLVSGLGGVALQNKFSLRFT